jgi:hypothetical protein
VNPVLRSEELVPYTLKSTFRKETTLDPSLDINKQYGTKGNTLLHVALEEPINSYLVDKLLFRKDLDVLRRNYDGIPPRVDEQSVSEQVYNVSNAWSLQDVDNQYTTLKMHIQNNKDLWNTLASLNQ